MKRSGFKRRIPPHEPQVEHEPKPFARSTVLMLHRATYSGSTSGEAVEKENALQHEGYMDLVRQMPCARCRKSGPSQFCHADMDKGTGIKTDCRRGFAGCPECHILLGSSGKIPREQRRELERQYGIDTRAAVLTSGQWPKRLPMWKESQ